MSATAKVKKVTYNRTAPGPPPETGRVATEVAWPQAFFMPWTMTVDSTRELVDTWVQLPALWMRMWASAMTVMTLGIPEINQESNLAAATVKSWTETQRMMMNTWCAMLGGSLTPVGMEGEPPPAPARREST